MPPPAPPLLVRALSVRDVCCLHTYAKFWSRRLCRLFLLIAPRAPPVSCVWCQLGQGGAECRGDADDPVRVDPRRLHAQALASLRGQLPPLAQHPHATAGPSTSVSACVSVSARLTPHSFYGVGVVGVLAGQLWCHQSGPAVRLFFLECVKNGRHARTVVFVFAMITRVYIDTAATETSDYFLTLHAPVKIYTPCFVPLYTWIRKHRP